MNQELLDKLKVISPEEEQILAGETEVQKSIYTAADDFIVDGSQMLDAGKLIDIRPHTRFVHFPRHKHNYIEIIYMCSGTTTHIINDTTKVTLDTGESECHPGNPACRGRGYRRKFHCASRVF